MHFQIAFRGVFILRTAGEYEQFQAYFYFPVIPNVLALQTNSIQKNMLMLAGRRVLRETRLSEGTQLCVCTSNLKTIRANMKTLRLISF